MYEIEIDQVNFMKLLEKKKKKFFIFIFILLIIN